MTSRSRIAMIAVGAMVQLSVAGAPARAQGIPIVRPDPFAHEGGSAMRLQVTPRDAEVFLDGVFVGSVDDFDGFFQHLRVRPGEHEIEIYKAGYHSVRQKIYVSPAGTFRVRYDMQALKSGETPDPRPVERTPPPRAARPPGPRERGQERGSTARGSGDASRSDAAGFGSISIRVQPGDAEIFIDGERWQGAGGDRLVVQTPAGRRHVEIRKPGSATFSQDVDVRPGETVTVNVSLRSEEE